MVPVPMNNDLAMNFMDFYFYFYFLNLFSVFHFLLPFSLASSCYIWKLSTLCGVCSCSCRVERTSAI
jgi:hypothetical protein